MSHGQSSRRLAQLAPVLIAAILGIGLTITSCGKRGGTSAWNTPPDGQHTAREVASPRPAPAAAVPVTPRPAAKGATTEGLRFIAYNVENWLTMDRYEGQKLLQHLPKPDSEKQAVIRILTNNRPDVIGLCEIGEAGDLKEIQRLLKAASLDLPYSQYTGGSDPVRHLGILSRFPLTPPVQPAAIDYRMKGQAYGINRGILDSSIQAHGKTYRFIGAHLKSKREIEEADQEEMRIHEARLLRRHVDEILHADARARLIVYGDFNDTRPSPSFKIVIGQYNEPGYLTAIPLKDSHGEAWTHYWAPHDIYSRFDFITVTRALKTDIDFRTSRIIDDPEWNDASDHRPLLAIFK